jgi:hypothetical protein
MLSKTRKLSMKRMKNVAAAAGAISGRSTQASRFSVLAPSSAAASRSSTGIAA